MKNTCLGVFTFVACISFESLAESLIITNKYSPDGKWLVKPQSENSPGNVNLFVPQFIDNCEPSIVDANSLLKNNSLFYSRSKLYKELFLELLLQTTAQDKIYAAEVSKKITAGATMGKMGIKLLGEANVIDKSSVIYNELPYQLKLVSMVFSVDYKVQQAAVEAAALYASLGAFTEARYYAIQNALNYSKYSDHAMNTGLNEAYLEITKLKAKDLETLKTNLATNSSVAEVSGGLVKMATGGLFGNIITTLAGSGMVSASLATALPTAWFWQLERTFNAEKSAASVVLLSTIERAVLAKVPDPSSNADIYTLYQLRSQLSYMIFNAANFYKINNSCQSNFEELTKKWIERWPYYDFAELALMKQKALNELKIEYQDVTSEEITPITPEEIENSPSETGTFTDARDGHIYKWVKIGSQVWMAENLAYRPNSGSFWSPNNSSYNIASFGYLYNWRTAQNICPSNWHLPSEEEIRTLLNNVGRNREEAYIALIPGGASCFSASLSGSTQLGFNGKRTFYGFGMQAQYWSSTPHYYTYSTFAYILSVNGYLKEASAVDLNLDSGYAVRCIKNLVE
jgi:uncharacterized protein (TIGR02145 family)